MANKMIRNKIMMWICKEKLILLPILLYLVYLYLLGDYIYSIIPTIITLIIFMPIQNKKIRIITIAIIMINSSVMVCLGTYLITNGKFIGSSDVNVELYVEEPLSPNSLEALTLLALKSLNETFGDKFTLLSTNRFQNDTIESYPDEYCMPAYERTKYRIGALFNNLIIRITAYKGVGHDMMRFNGNHTNAAGTSNFGGAIHLFFNSTFELVIDNNHINDNIQKISTILHEFGHSLGLPHNTKSPIMYTSEKNENRAFVEEPSLNVTPDIVFLRMNWPDNFSCLFNMNPGYGEILQYFASNNYISGHLINNATLINFRNRDSQINVTEILHRETCFDNVTANLVYLEIEEDIIRNGYVNTTTIRYPVLCIQILNASEFNECWTDNEINAIRP